MLLLSLPLRRRNYPLSIVKIIIFVQGSFGRCWRFWEGKSHSPTKTAIGDSITRFLVCYCFCLKLILHWVSLSLITKKKKCKTLSVSEMRVLDIYLKQQDLEVVVEKYFSPVCPVKCLLLVTLYFDNDLFSLRSSAFSLNSLLCLCLLVSPSDASLSYLYCVSRRKAYPAHFSPKLVIFRPNDVLPLE